MTKLKSSDAGTASKLTVVNDDNITNYSAKGQISNENIFTTRDKAALVFHEYVRHKAWTSDWLAYFSLFVGLLIPLMTSEFKGIAKGNTMVVSAGVCKGLVIILCVTAFMAFLTCLARRIFFMKELTCEYFLEQLKKTKVNVD